MPKEEFVSLAEEDRPKFRFDLLKGEAASGKSIAAASYPRPHYVLDFDGKTDQLYKYYPDIEPFLFVKRPTSRAAILSILGTIYNKNPAKGATLIVDSLTSMCVRIIESVKDSKGIKTDNSGGTRIVAGVPILTQEGYGVESSALTTIICTKLKELSRKMNVVLIAHVLNDDPVDGKVLRRSLMTGGRKVAQMLPGDFKSVYHFVAKTGKRGTQYLVHTRSTTMDFARTPDMHVPDELDLTGAGRNGKPSFYQLLQKYEEN